MAFTARRVNAKNAFFTSGLSSARPSHGLGSGRLSLSPQYGAISLRSLFSGEIDRNTFLPAGGR